MGPTSVLRSFQSIRLVVLALVTWLATADRSLFCSHYVGLCDAFLAATGCTSSAVSACGAPSSGLAVAGHFAADPTSSQYSLALHNADNRAVPNGVAECKCFSPFYFDVSDARIGELLWDVAVKASIPRIQVGVSPGSTAAPLNARASFLATCSTALTRLGCPIASQSVDASSTTAPWVCECAGYTTGDHRASEGLIDNLVSVLNTPSVPVTTPNFVCGTAPDRYQSLCSVTLLALGCYSTVPVGSPKGGALWTVRV